LMAHSYSHLFRLPATGLRFFTVYGPWGRPDMAIFIFAKAILGGQPIKLFNHGNMRRDFTYIDDVSDAVVRLLDRPPEGNPDWNGERPDPATSTAPWKIYNIGNNKPEELMYVVSILEKEFGRRATTEMLPMQLGDIPATYADVEDLYLDIGFRPSTTIEDGIARFAKWYREYYTR
jgi:UDP-glucuronate 4-epimerase